MGDIVLPIPKTALRRIGPWGKAVRNPSTLKEKLAHARENLGKAITVLHVLYMMARASEHDPLTKLVSLSMFPQLSDFTQRTVTSSNIANGANGAFAAQNITRSATTYLGLLQELRLMMMDPSTDPVLLFEFRDTQFEWSSFFVNALEEAGPANVFSSAPGTTIMHKTCVLSHTDMSSNLLLFEELIVRSVIAGSKIIHARGWSYMSLRPDNIDRIFALFKEAGDDISTGAKFLNRFFPLSSKTDASCLRVRGDDYILYMGFWQYLDSLRGIHFHAFETALLNRKEWQTSIALPSGMETEMAKCGLATRAQLSRAKCAAEARDALMTIRMGLRRSACKRQIRGTGTWKLMKNHGAFGAIKRLNAMAVYVRLIGIITLLYGVGLGLKIPSHINASARAKLAGVFAHIGNCLGDTHQLNDVEDAYADYQKALPESIFGYIYKSVGGLMSSLLSKSGASPTNYEGTHGGQDAYSSAFEVLMECPSVYMLLHNVKALPIATFRFSPAEIPELPPVHSAAVRKIRKENKRVQDAIAAASSLPSPSTTTPGEEEASEYEYSYEEEEVAMGKGKEEMRGQIMSA
jgi:hypothetical protein